MYIGIQQETGRHVAKEDAISYALKRCLTDKEDYNQFIKEFGKELEEWFFSGNWVEEKEKTDGEF